MCGNHLCTGDTYLWSRVDMDAAVTFPTDGAADSVGDSDDEGATLLTIPEGHQGISSLTCKQRQRHVSLGDITSSTTELLLVPDARP